MKPFAPLTSRHFTLTLTSKLLWLALALGLLSLSFIGWRVSADSALRASFAPPVAPFATGEALDFDGVDDRVNLNGTFGGPTWTEATLEAWVYVKATNPSNGFQAILSPSDASFVHFQMGEPANPFFSFFRIAIYTDIGGITLPIIPTTPTGQWRHMAVVIKSGDSKVYVDGQQLGATTTDTFNYITASNAVMLGQGFAEPGNRQLNGKLDEVRIWNVARTQAQIQATMNKELLGTEANLVAYYNFNQGIANGPNPTETTLLDRTGNGYNGTLTNFALNGNTSNWVAPGPNFNTAPTITPMAQTVAKSSSVPNLKIATVNDAEDAKNTLTVTISSDGVNFNPSATLNGVTVNSINVDSNGNVTATVTTTANAASTSFTLKVTDSGGLMNTAALNVTVVTYTSRLSDPIVCLGPGSGVTGTIQLSNPNNAVLPFTLNTTFANMVGVPNSCTLTGAVAGATCTVTAGGLMASGSIPANTTLTVQYLAQVAQVPSGTTVTASSTATLNMMTVQPDPLVFSQTVNCPTVGPGTPPPAAAAVSDQKAGSVLFFNLYTSNPADLTRQNTRINITNTDPARSVAVHLFFVDGASCTPADSYICLTPNQTLSFTAADVDPGTTGYIVAVASDSTTGCPISFNALIGDEFVKLSSGHQANLAAESFAALAGGLPLCDATSSTATLNFDGVSYNQVPRVVAVDNFPSTADGNNTLLILNRVGGDLRNGASTIGALFGVLYDEAEQPLSFTLASNTCQFRFSLTNSSLRTAQRLETVVSAGRTGWLRLWGVSDIGLLGSVINLNSSAGVNNFSQGHNLHKLTFTNATLTIPIIPPAC